MNNIFAVYKPSGMTSHHVVNLVRRATGVKRVGHGGTLDPLAEGVLVIAVGRENTKKLDTYTKGGKEYEAEITLGITSTTDDGDGDKTIVDVHTPPTTDRIRDVLKQFEGEILQTPPIYSSIKIQGKPAHRRVRRGEVVELEPRKAIIKNVKLHSYHYPTLTISVETGPGVYIRSLARDIGKSLGTGGYLSKLVRTRVGEFTLENSHSIEEIQPSHT